MKKLVLSVFFISMSSTLLFAQAHSKGDILINAGIGFGLYGANYQYVNTSNGDKTTGSGAAASFITPLTAEYALHDKWGVGLQVSPAFYADSATKKTTSMGLGIFGSYHLLNKERFELYTRLGAGYGNLKHVENKTDGTYSWNLKGFYVRPSVGMRKYFGEHIGFFADLALGSYSFSAGEYKDPNGTVDLKDGKLTFNTFGVEVSTGLAVKF
jgi:hypothetical protein